MAVASAFRKLVGEAQGYMAAWIDHKVEKVTMEYLAHERVA
jgi:hypothetical protein